MDSHSKTSLHPFSGEPLARAATFLTFLLYNIYVLSTPQHFRPHPAPSIVSYANTCHNTTEPAPFSQHTCRDSLHTWLCSVFGPVCVVTETPGRPPGLWEAGSYFHNTRCMRPCSSIHSLHICFHTEPRTLQTLSQRITTFSSLCTTFCTKRSHSLHEEMPGSLPATFVSTLG